MSRRTTTASRTPRRSRPRGAPDRALIVVERLAAEYPAETALEHRNAWELLVATILSAQTTDERVNMVTPRLFARYPTPEAMAGAVLADVEEIIRPTGFYHSKAHAVVEMSQDVVARHGGEVPARMEDLVALRGVGRKTANVVLGVAFGVPGFAVDTHVARLTRRLGLTRQTDPVKIEADVCAMVPPVEWSNLSLRLILHGRRVCHARVPECERCVLNDICPSAFIVAGKQSTARRPRPSATKKMTR